MKFIIKQRRATGQGTAENRYWDEADTYPEALNKILARIRFDGIGDGKHIAFLVFHNNERAEGRFAAKYDRERRQFV